MGLSLGHGLIGGYLVLIHAGSALIAEFGVFVDACSAFRAVNASVHSCETFFQFSLSLQAAADGGEFHKEFFLICLCGILEYLFSHSRIQLRYIFLLFVDLGADGNRIGDLLCTLCHLFSGAADASFHFIKNRHNSGSPFLCIYVYLIQSEP